MTWKDNWTHVRESETSLERLRLSLIWAICHVHERVEIAEDNFDCYVRTGALSPEHNRLRDAKERGIESVHAWLYDSAFDFAAWLKLPDDAKLLTVMWNVYGLGAVKASFALTSGGFTDIACLDSHIYNYRLQRSAPSFAGIPTSPTSALDGTRARRCISNLRRYLLDVTAAYGRVHGSGYEQWADYEQLQDTFARDGHAVYFNALGIGG